MLFGQGMCSEQLLTSYLFHGDEMYLQITLELLEVLKVKD